ncbi:WXG100 family type VII secretion target [Streptomyces sp. NPDC048639]|uniref:WXG100 family type VII secretion target n=1 Tax=Streptomyces sp. NPDC048639 TaxID=3365581 RepID=UPI00371EC589
MSEGVAEQVYEAGIELVNPGGRPDVLRAAAKGWRDMSDALEEAYRAVDKQVEMKLGEHWRGDSADAFSAHWTKVGNAVRETVPLFEEAAKGLDEAAKNIEEINDQIHQIYVEIGVSIGASVALSFVTLGFSAAAGAANAARLALQAANAASKLGKLLSMAARMFRGIRTFARAGKLQRLTVELGVQWAAGTGTGIATSLATKGEFELGNNMANGAFGALGGKYIAGPLTERLGGGLVGSATGGATAGAAASLAGDTVNNLRNGEKFDASQMALGAAFGGLTSGSGSAAVHRATDGQAFSGARGMAGDVATNAPISVGLGIEGNIVKEIDAVVYGDPNAEAPEDKPGSASEARKEAEGEAKDLQSRPDPRKYGAFG